MSTELVSPPKRVLLTLDAVGGVWRYAVDLARGLADRSIQVVLVGLGPQPSQSQRKELESLGDEKIFWLTEPLDWLARDESELRPLRTRLLHLVEDHEIDLLHLNSPSQARGLAVQCPVVVMSHSCVATWWKAVRHSALPSDWLWQLECNRLGFARADAVLSPSRSHAAALVHAYGPLEELRVVPNSSRIVPARSDKEPFVLAAGRWWDEGKNGRILDAAAARSRWPVVMVGATEGPHGESIQLQHARTLGQRSVGEVYELMGRASVFAAPSRFEPFGLAVLEAALHGAALLLSDIPTFRELWTGAAVFARPEDPKAWSDALDRLAQDGEHRVRLGGLAKSRAQQFSHNRQMSTLLEAYREASLRATRRAA